MELQVSGDRDDAIRLDTDAGEETLTPGTEVEGIENRLGGFAQQLRQLDDISWAAGTVIEASSHLDQFRETAFPDAH